MKIVPEIFSEICAARAVCGANDDQAEFTFDLPDGARLLASSEVTVNQAFLYGEKVLGLQFHLETTEESMRTLYQHCSDEIVDVPTIQPLGTALEKVQGEEAPLQAANGLMNKLLDDLMGSS